MLTYTVRYQSQMLRSLSEVGSVDSVVGFYQSVKLDAFFKQSLVEAQAIHQEKLRHGGIVIVHGMKRRRLPPQVTNSVPRYNDHISGERVFPCFPSNETLRRGTSKTQLQLCKVTSRRFRCVANVLTGIKA